MTEVHATHNRSGPNFVYEALMGSLITCGVVPLTMRSLGGSARLLVEGQAVEHERIRHPPAALQRPPACAPLSVSAESQRLLGELMEAAISLVAVVASGGEQGVRDFLPDVCDVKTHLIARGAHHTRC